MTAKFLIPFGVQHLSATNIPVKTAVGRINNGILPILVILNCIIKSTMQKVEKIPKKISLLYALFVMTTYTAMRNSFVLLSDSLQAGDGKCP